MSENPDGDLPPLNIIIMAGGLGKRMMSDLPKVLHKVGGVPMLVRLINQAVKLEPKNIIIIVGQYYRIIDDTIQEYVSDQVYNKYIRFALQEVPMGTADAVKSTLHMIDGRSRNMILNGDHPLITEETLLTMDNHFVDSNIDLQITAIEADDPTGLGRICLVENKFTEIVEEKDATPEQKAIKLVNLGIYIVSGDVLKHLIPKIENHNAQGEYYLTDIVGIYRKNYELDVGLVVLPKEKQIETMGVNTKEQLEALEKLIN